MDSLRRHMNSLREPYSSSSEAASVRLSPSVLTASTGYSSARSTNFEPPPARDNGRTSKLQARWEEMNRREEMDREFDINTPRTDLQMEELNDKKSKEEHRRRNWDLNQKSQSTANASAESANPRLAAAPERRGSEKLAKVKNFFMKFCTKAIEAIGINGHKEGEQKNGRSIKRRKKMKGKEKAERGEEGEGGNNTEQIHNSGLDSGPQGDIYPTPPHPGPSHEPHTTYRELTGRDHLEGWISYQ